MVINSKRLVHQIYLNVVLRWKPYLMIIAISIFILIFHFYNKEFSLLELITSKIGSTTIFPSRTTPDIHKFHFRWFPVFFLLTTSIITSLSFSEYGENRSSIFHLSLPSTTTEKWLSKVVVALIIVPVSLILIYQVFIFFSQWWGEIDDHYQVQINVLDPYLRPTIISTILLQGLIILGAIWYRKYSIGKSLLAASAIILSYNLILIISLILISDNTDILENLGIQGLTSIQDLLTKSDLRTSVEHKSFIETFMGNNLSLGIVSMLGLGLSYVRYKELEA